MKHLAVLGSTGSIGQSTLRVVRRFPERFRVVSLSVDANVKGLLSQIREFHPARVCVRNAKAAAWLRGSISRRTKVYVGEVGMQEMLAAQSVDDVVLAISGSAALMPFWSALSARVNVITANKEALVMAGELLVREAVRRKVLIKPVDSEQSAIWQCLRAENLTRLRKIYLTASGGPFRNLSRARLSKISVRDALRHPRWKMGKKITIDSATLMNKGLEVIEAMRLFGVCADQIDVVIHPEAVIHSMVEFVDGICLAQMSVPTMEIPIQYALTYPERIPGEGVPKIDFIKLRALHFEKPDMKAFACLHLAYEAARCGGTMPAVLNAANEVCVEAFLNKKIRFLAIADIISAVMREHTVCADPDCDAILAADRWARQSAQEKTQKGCVCQ